MKPARLLSLALVAVVVGSVAVAAPASAAKPTPGQGILTVAGTGATWLNATDDAGNPMGPMHYANITFTVDPVMRGRGWVDPYGYYPGKIVTTADWMDAQGQTLVTHTETVPVARGFAYGVDAQTEWLPGSVAMVRVTAVMYAWQRHGWVQIDAVATPDLAVPAPSTWMSYEDCTTDPPTALFSYTDTD